MAECRVIGCGSYGVSTLGSCAGEGSGAWGTAVLNMSASFLRADVCFYPRFEMGKDGVGLCRASVRSAAALVTASSGNRPSEFFWTGNSLVVSDTRSGAVLVMWDVRHL